MTDKLKELIDTAPKRTVGTYDKLMFVSNGAYDGFWGANGYDHILILGWERKTNKWYKISDYGDKFDIFQAGMRFNLDIPSEFGVPCIWFDSPVYINNYLEASNVIGELRPKDQE